MKIPQRITRVWLARLWLHMTALDVRDWCLRWIHAQHNARVIRDFENRMTSVIHAATGVMSKPYYTADAMLTEIAAAQARAYDDAYAEGRRDLADELGVIDPSPVSPE